MTQPQVSVGIVSGRRIDFTLHDTYAVGDERVCGTQHVELHDGCMHWCGRACTNLLFTPCDTDASFTLADVVIGIRFHWERHEAQTFRGALQLVADGGQICVVNRLPVEDYLFSVISSEMNAEAPLEFLKAHAVISRSWVMGKIGRSAAHSQGPGWVGTSTLLRWYDASHKLFDVCADDHCQRYQGISRATSPAVAEAVEATRGQVLTYGGEICDARFSKCCGGRTEQFETCWDDVHKPYLESVDDCAEPGARPFCDTTDRPLLARVLNNYDQETPDFYRWQRHCSKDELSALVREKLGRDLGQIVDLVPIERGPSGRISLLRIVGTKDVLTVGKELEIRRLLSPTHLLSSAFTVEHTPDGFLLRGAGWGHGVGLCQIGAAVMSTQGYNYQQILHHYYRAAQVETLY